MNDAARYPLTVFWSPEDNAYIAEARDLPGCSAVGETASDAIEEAKDAIASWMQAAQDAGKPIPPPTSFAAPQTFSGKLLVRMPRSLHATLSSRAESEGVSLNQWVVHVLTMGSVGISTAGMDALTNVHRAALSRITTGRFSTFWPGFDIRGQYAVAPFVSVGEAEVDDANAPMDSLNLYFDDHLDRHEGRGAVEASTPAYIAGHLLHIRGNS